MVKTVGVVVGSMVRAVRVLMVWMMWRKRR
jgi:hypothetical protein